MKFSDGLFDTIYKMYTFRPRLRKALTWLTFHVGKMPQYHINLTPGDVGPYALMTTDQANVPHFAGYLDSSEKLTEHREYLSYRGILLGKRVVVISMGYASPPLAIGMEELALNGVKAFIYAGTCRPMQPHVKRGDIILVEGAVREDGTSYQYVPASFPAVPDPFITSYLLKACQKAGVPYHQGICLTQDVDTLAMKGETKLFNSSASENTDIWEKAGVLGAEMCAATLFSVAQALRGRAGCLLQVEEPPGSFSPQFCEVIIEGLRLLIQEEEG